MVDVVGAAARTTFGSEASRDGSAPLATVIDATNVGDNDDADVAQRSLPQTAEADDEPFDAETVDPETTSLLAAPPDATTTAPVGARTLAAQLSAARGSGVTQLAFLAQEPVLVSAGGDNALKMWLCDDAGARLLRERAGHAAPPSIVQFYSGFSQVRRSQRARTPARKQTFR